MEGTGRIAPWVQLGVHINIGDFELDSVRICWSPACDLLAVMGPFWLSSMSDEKFLVVFLDFSRTSMA